MRYTGLFEYRNVVISVIKEGNNVIITFIIIIFVIICVIKVIMWLKDTR